MRARHDEAWAPRRSGRLAREQVRGGRPAPSAASTALYAVPVLDDYLVSAPLHGLTALVNGAALGAIAGGAAVSGAIGRIVETMRAPGDAPPLPRQGPVDHPLFLGIVPTRACTMDCAYCTFLDAPSAPAMSLDTARAAVDAYLDLVEGAGSRRAEIHFFGGEPLHAPEVVELVVARARISAAERGLALHLEISTNGLVPAARATWLGDQFDAIVLSLDGPPAVHDRHRPSGGGLGTYEVVFRTAQILSASSADLVIRSCVTQGSLPTLVDWAETIARELHPSTVCFERLTPSARSDAAGLRSPDPYGFARAFVLAARILRDHGIEAVTSTTDLGPPRLSCCPVGEDALIVSPDGAVNACYLLEDRWRDRGLDLRLGSLDALEPVLHLDGGSVARVRALAAARAPRCEGCLCRLRCAGGCHVDHRATDGEGYDDLCVSTRLITIAQMVERIGFPDRVSAWLADGSALMASALQPSDLLHEVRA